MYRNGSIFNETYFNYNVVKDFRIPKCSYEFTIIILYVSQLIFSQTLDLSTFGACKLQKLWNIWKSKVRLFVSLKAFFSFGKQEMHSKYLHKIVCWRKE